MPQTQTHTEVSKPKPPPVQQNGAAPAKAESKKPSAPLKASVPAKTTKTPKAPKAKLDVEHTLTELDLFALNREFAERIHEISTIYLEGMETLQGECFAIAADRIDAQFEAAQSLMDASGPGDFARVQQAWAKKVADQYVHEAYRLLDLVARTSSHAWSPVISSDSQTKLRK